MGSENRGGEAAKAEKFLENPSLTGDKVLREEEEGGSVHLDAKVILQYFLLSFIYFQNIFPQQEVASFYLAHSEDEENCCLLRKSCVTRSFKELECSVEPEWKQRQDRTRGRGGGRQPTVQCFECLEPALLSSACRAELCLSYIVQPSRFTLLHQNGNFIPPEQ